VTGDEGLRAAVTGLIGLAAALADAITLNPDVRANALRDEDLAGVRKAAPVAALLGG
jgi:hypothetical protein